MSIRCCWNCNSPFALSRKHTATGFEVISCANNECNAPWNLHDDVQYDFVASSAKNGEVAQGYVDQWRNARIAVAGAI